jgi:hypothetical protein
MICALLVFQTPDLPDSLARLSPWLDWLITPQDEVYARLAAQDHRRFIKSHTPLDGLPADPRATFIVTGRHPLDMAVSLYHQGDNLNRERMAELTGQAAPVPNAGGRPPLHEWLLTWIDREVDPRDSLDSLPGVLWHASDAWNRRASQDVVLVHYDDLVRDLGGAMHRLAERLGIVVPADTWPDLIDAATFTQMKAKAASLAPGASGILKSQAAFFRRGSSGEGTETLSAGELERYYQRASEMAPPAVLSWLHRGAGSEHPPPGANR